MRDLVELAGMRNDRVRLPFHFLVSSGQGHLKKARFFRRSGMNDRELLFLQKFQVLVSSSIPSHPHYSQKSSDSAVLELQSQLEDVRKRIQELEVDPAWLNTSASRVRRVMASSSIKRGMRSQPEDSEGEAQLEPSSSTNRVGSEIPGLRSLSPALSPKRLQRRLRAVVRDSSNGQEKQEWLGVKLEEEEEHCSAREGLKVLKEQVLAPRNCRDQGKEFRMALNAFEKLQSEKQSEYVIKRQKADCRSYSSNTDKLEDVDCIKHFIACGRSLLDAQTNLQSPSSKIEDLKELASTSRGSDRMTSMASSTVRSNQQEQTQQSSNSRSSDRTSSRSGSKPLQQEQSEQRTSKKKPELADENRRADTSDSLKKSKHDSSGEADKKLQRLVDEQMDSSQRLSTLIAVTEQALGVMGHDIRCVKQEQDSLRFGNRSMRLELRSAQEAGLQLKEEVEALMTGQDVKVSEIHQLLFSLQVEVQKVKEEVVSFKTVEESLKLDKQSIKEMLDLVHSVAARKEELQALKTDQEEAYRRLLLEGEKEKAGLMNRIKRLSQLYLRGLQDVRSEVLNLKALSESRVDSLMEDMKSRIEGVMKNAIDAAVKLQEKYTVELEKAKHGWNWAMNVQIEEAKALLKDFAEQRQSVCGTLGGQNVLLGRIQRVEDELSQLRAATNRGAGTYDDIAQHQELIERDLERLDDQMQDVKKKVEQALSRCDEQKTMNLDRLEEKMREATKTWSDNIIEMGKKVWSLEESQATTASSVEELRIGKSGLNSEAELRLEAAETSIKAQASESSSIADKVDNLQDQVGHVRTDTMTKLRLLDSKLETCEVGIEQALTGASVAEKKCGVLGGEIVKVFRMLAARNGKLGGSELSKPVTEKDEVKERRPAHSGCSCCSKTGWSTAANAAQEKRRTKDGAPSFIESYAETCYASSHRKDSSAGSSREHGRSGKRTNVKLDAGITSREIV